MTSNNYHGSQNLLPYPTQAPVLTPDRLAHDLGNLEILSPQAPWEQERNDPIQIRSRPSSALLTPKSGVIHSPQGPRPFPRSSPSAQSNSAHRHSTYNALPSNNSSPHHLQETTPRRNQLSQSVMSPYSQYHTVTPTATTPPVLGPQVYNPPSTNSSIYQSPSRHPTSSNTSLKSPGIAFDANRSYLPVSDLSPSRKSTVDRKSEFQNPFNSSITQKPTNSDREPDATLNSHSVLYQNHHSSPPKPFTPLTKQSSFPKGPSFNPLSIDIPIERVIIRQNSYIQRSETLLSKELPETPLEKSTRQSLDANQLPDLRFSVSLLTPEQYDQCGDVSELSDIYRWSLKLNAEWVGGSITEQDYLKSLKNLLIHKQVEIPSYNLEPVAYKILKSFNEQNAIFSHANGCIDFLDNARVYGQLSTLLEGVNAQAQSEHGIITADTRLTDWQTFWGVTKEDIQSLDADLVKKQCHIFDLIKLEQNIIKLGNIQVNIYGKCFKKAALPLVDNPDRFYEAAFKSVVPLIKLHEISLLAPLINVMRAQGKFISGIGGILKNWVSLATVKYLKLTKNATYVTQIIEAAKSSPDSPLIEWFKEIDQMDDIKQQMLTYDRVFFSGFTFHLVSLSNNLRAILDYTKKSDNDYNMIDDVISDIDKLLTRMDVTRGSALQNAEAMELKNKIIWKSSISPIDLELDHPNRRIVHRGYLTEKRPKDRLTKPLSLLILLDNCLLIIDEKDGGVLKATELPIPTQYLQFEIFEEDGSLFPFAVRYTGQSISHILYAKSAEERNDWFNAYNEVKANLLSSSNGPFKLSFISDWFGYGSSGGPQKLPILVENSNVDTMLKESVSLARRSEETNIYPTVSSAATVISNHKSYYFVGTSQGLYVTESNNLKGWKRVLHFENVSQIQQLREILLLTSDKKLYYFELASLLKSYEGIDQSVINGRLVSEDSTRYFNVSDYSSIPMLFVLSAPSLASKATKLKVYQIAFDIFGKFDYFQLQSMLNYQFEVINVSSLGSALITHSSKGFLKFKLENTAPNLIPRGLGNITNPTKRLETIKHDLKSAKYKPLLVTKYLKSNILIYDTVALVIDTHGSFRGDEFILPFNFECSTVAIKNERYLICVTKDLIKIFDLEYDEPAGFKYTNPIQIIIGKDIRLIDNISPKFAMAHPTKPNRQILFSL